MSAVSPVSVLGLLDVGPLEMLVLTAAAIMLFGGDLPDIARKAGRMIGRLRAAASDLTREVDPPADLLHLPDPDAEMHRPPLPPTATLGAPPPPPSSAASPPQRAPNSPDSPPPSSPTPESR